MGLPEIRPYQARLRKPANDLVSNLESIIPLLTALLVESTESIHLGAHAPTRVSIWRPQTASGLIAALNVRLTPALAHKGGEYPANGLDDDS